VRGTGKHKEIKGKGPSGPGSRLCFLRDEVLPQHLAWRPGSALWCALSAAAKAIRKVIMKRTYQASKVRRARTHGFLVRMKTRGGRAVINARRAKGRKRLAV
jgi:large subunit ribosomal protein L34